jgi:hypothetical protein
VSDKVENEKQSSSHSIKEKQESFQDTRLTLLVAHVGGYWGSDNRNNKQGLRRFVIWSACFTSFFYKWEKIKRWIKRGPVLSKMDLDLIRISAMGA